MIKFVFGDFNIYLLVPILFLTLRNLSYLYIINIKYPLK